MHQRVHFSVSRRRFLRSVAAGALAMGAAVGTGLSTGLRKASAETGGRPSQAGRRPAPQCDSVFQAALGTQAMGYAYAYAQNGTPIGGAAVNRGRSQNEVQNPNQAWTLDTLFNLASLSKAITAVALMTVVQQQGSQILDAPFWSVLADSGRFSGPPGSGVDGVTFRQLLTHFSGLVADDTLYTPNNQSIDDFLTAFLQQPLAHPAGSTYEYSNTNFTILGVLYEILSGGAPGSYVQLVKDNVLTPMGIDTTSEITDTPDPMNEAVSYSGATDTRPGRVWAPMQCMAPGGWLGTVNGMLKFMLGIRANAVLDAPTVQMMFSQQLGWFWTDSPYGPYFHKNGWLYTDAQPRQELYTGAAIFPGGYDVVLFVNSTPGAPVSLMAGAFGAPPPLRDS